VVYFHISGPGQPVHPDKGVVEIWSCMQILLAGTPDLQVHTACGHQGTGLVQAMFPDKLDKLFRGHHWLM
jgi:hypothetical protein